MKEYNNRHDKPLVNKPITEKEYTLTKLVDKYNEVYRLYYTAYTNEDKETLKSDLDKIRKEIEVETFDKE